MNTLQIMEKCEEMYRNNPPKNPTSYDYYILNTLILLYNQTVEIDYEEVLWLWEGYISKGVLDFRTAMQNARRRVK